MHKMAQLGQRSGAAAEVENVVRTLRYPLNDAGQQVTIRRIGRHDRVVSSCEFVPMGSYERLRNHASPPTVAPTDWLRLSCLSTYSASTSSESISDTERSSSLIEIWKWFSTQMRSSRELIESRPRADVRFVSGIVSGLWSRWSACTMMERNWVFMSFIVFLRKSEVVKLRR